MKICFPVLLLLFAVPFTAQADTAAEPPLALPIPVYLEQIPRDHWAYMALSDLAASDIIPRAKIPPAPQTLTRMEIAVLTALAIPKVDSTLANAGFSLGYERPFDIYPAERKNQNATAVAALVKQFTGELTVLGIPQSTIKEFLNPRRIPQTGESHPFMRQLRQKIAEALNQDRIDAAPSLEKNELTVEFKTQDFFIYTTNMDGSVGSQPYLQRGPLNGGFLLTIQFSHAPVQPKQASKISGGHRDKYWTVFWDDAYIQKYPPEAGKTDAEKKEPFYDQLYIYMRQGHGAPTSWEKINRIVNETIAKYQAENNIPQVGRLADRLF